MGNKAEDFYHAASCHSCHAELDQGRRFSKEEKRDFWQAAWEKTIALYFKNDWLKVVA